MAANSVVRARIDEQTKNEAAAVLKAMGLTIRCLPPDDGQDRQGKGAPVRAARAE